MPLLHSALLPTLALLLLGALAVSADYALLGYASSTSAGSPASSHSVCFVFNPSFADIAGNYSALPVVLSSPSDGCGNLALTDTYQGKAVLVVRGNCTFAVKAQLAQSLGAALLVIVNSDPSGGAFVPSGNSSNYESIYVPVGMLSSQDGAVLIDAVTKNSSAVRLTFTTPDATPVDPSFFIMCLTAVIVVVAGAYWSNSDERARLHAQLGKDREDASAPSHRRPSPEQTDRASLEESPENALKPPPESDEHLTLSARNVLIFVGVAVSVILLMYFLYDYLVYIVIAMFCIGSCNALFTCLHPLVQRLPVGLADFPLPCFGRVQLRSFVLALLCMGLTVFWAVNRNASFGWAIQDLLGAAFVAVIIKTIRLPNLKVTSILLVLFFFYDIFFVFITPLFTGNGESVMVQVATGGGTSTEQLPMVFKLPKLSDPYSVCGSAYTVLGFGDLVMPGFLVAFCLTFDYRRRMLDVLVKGSLRGKVKVASVTVPAEPSESAVPSGEGDQEHGSDEESYQRSQRVLHRVVFASGETLDDSIVLRNTHPSLQVPDWTLHFVACAAAYTLGLVITYVALVKSRMAQPALLYLVPCTLGCTLLIGWWKGELAVLWRGVWLVREEVSDVGRELLSEAEKESEAGSGSGPATVLQINAEPEGTEESGRLGEDEDSTADNVRLLRSD